MANAHLEVIFPRYLEAYLDPCSCCTLLRDMYEAETVCDVQLACRSPVARFVAETVVRLAAIWRAFDERPILA